jgi:hypothetical protein
MQNSIGSFPFIDLAGPLGLPSSVIALLVRAGVDGQTLVDDGQRGEPFTLRSKLDVASMADGVNEFDGYRGLVGTDPVSLVYQDVDLDGLASFSVLGVKMVQLKALVGAVGGLNPPSGAWLEADWTLVAEAPG